MRAFLLTTATAIAMSASAAQADVWQEREALAKVASEISALERLVHDASKINQADGRVKFNYDTLMADLELIRSGIAAHLSQPINPVIPSSVDGINGGYTIGNR